MRLGKVLCGAAMRTLALCRRSIHGEYFGQVTRDRVAVKVVVSI
jgi:hypothetical protein